MQICLAREKDLGAIKKLGKNNSATLGFLPEGAFEQRLNEGNVLVDKMRIEKTLISFFQHEEIFAMSYDATYLGCCIKLVLTVMLCMVSSARGAAPILDAAQRGDVSRVKALLSENPNALNARDREGKTPLHLAAWESREEVAQVLVHADADVNACDKNGATPLHLAAFILENRIGRLLVANKGHVNVCDASGRTPLHYASAAGNLWCAQFLLQKGALLQNKDCHGRTARDYAIFIGHEKMVAFFEARKAPATIASKTSIPESQVRLATDLETASIILQHVYRVFNGRDDMGGRTHAQNATALLSLDGESSSVKQLLASDDLSDRVKAGLYIKAAKDLSEIVHRAPYNVADIAFDKERKCVSAVLLYSKVGKLTFPKLKSRDLLYFHGEVPVRIRHKDLMGFDRKFSVQLLGPMTLKTASGEEMILGADSELTLDPLTMKKCDILAAQAICKGLRLANSDELTNTKVIITKNDITTRKNGAPSVNELRVSPVALAQELPAGDKFEFVDFNATEIIEPKQSPDLAGAAGLPYKLNDKLLQMFPRGQRGVMAEVYIRGKMNAGGYPNRGSKVNVFCPKNLDIDAFQRLLEGNEFTKQVKDGVEYWRPGKSLRLEPLDCVVIKSKRVYSGNEHLVQASVVGRLGKEGSFARCCPEVIRMISPSTVGVDIIRGHMKLVGDLPACAQATWSGMDGELLSGGCLQTRIFWVYEREEDTTKALAELQEAKPKLIEKMKKENTIPGAPKNTRIDTLNASRKGTIVILTIQGLRPQQKKKNTSKQKPLQTNSKNM